MTKNEARQLLANVESVELNFGNFMPPDNAHEALNELLLRPPSIAQSIRNAAINWPQFLGDVECQILDAFCFMDGFRFRDDLMHGNTKEKYQARTFMLLVAEALE